MSTQKTNLHLREKLVILEIAVSSPCEGIRRTDTQVLVEISPPPPVQWWCTPMGQFEKKK